MAITHERVTLSQVNFEMFKFDYTDINNLNVPIITNFTSFDDVPIMNRYNVYAQMLMNGIDNMPLYDNQQHVIGSLSVDQYKIEYVTAQVYTATYLQPGEYGVDEQTSDSAYPAYQDSTSTTTYIGGVQFRRVTSTIGGIPVRFKANLNGYDMYHAFDYPNIITQINDINGYWPAERVKHLLLTPGGFGSTSVGLMTRTRSGVTTTYLEFAYLNSGTGFDFGVTGTWDYETLVADNLNITDYIVTEDGYVNELDDRFSPRAHSVMTGMYVIYADNDDLQMTDIAKSMFSFKFADWIENHFFGSDGKDMVVGINWFYGLRATLAAKNNIIGPSDIRIGGSFLRKTDDPNDVIQANNLAREFIMWETPELYLKGKYNDYRDYLANYKIYLPYYGFADIDPNDAVNAYIKVYYNINLYSRAADIVITTRSARTNNLEEKIMTLTTTVGEEVPFGADACRNMMTALAQTAGKAITAGSSIALGARGGQIDAAIASNNASIAYDTSMMSSSMISNKKDYIDLNAASKGVTDTLSDNAALRSKSAGIKAAQNAIPDMPNMALPSTNRSNGSGSENGSLDELHPYVMISWPVTCEPNDWEDYVGMPASASTYLNANLGFTQVGAVHPDSMANAPKYIDEIIALLKAGVYL